MGLSNSVAPGRAPLTQCGARVLCEGTGRGSAVRKSERIDVVQVGRFGFDCPFLIIIYNQR